MAVQAASQAGLASSRGRYVTVSTDEEDYDKEGLKLDEYLLREADQLTGQYFEAGSYEDRLFYVREDPRPEIYIFWTGYSEGEGYWCFSPILGGSWTTCLAYTTADKELVPYVDWMMQGQNTRYHIRCPIKVSRPQMMMPKKTLCHNCLCAPLPPKLTAREYIGRKKPVKGESGGYDETKDIMVGPRHREIEVDGVKLTLKPKIEEYEPLPPPPDATKTRAQWVRLRPRHSADEDPYLVDQLRKFTGEYIEKGHHEERPYYVKKGADNKSLYIFWGNNLDGTGGWYLSAELGGAWTVSDLWSLEATPGAPEVGWMMRGKWGFETEAPVHVEVGVHYKKPARYSCFGEFRQRTVKDTMTFDEAVAHEIACGVPFFTAIRDETRNLFRPTRDRGVSMKQRAHNTADKASNSVFDLFCLEMGCIVPAADAMGDWFQAAYETSTDGLLSCISGKDKMKIHAMHLTMTNREIWAKVLKAWRKSGYANWRVWWIEMGCDVPISVAVDDLIHQFRPALRALGEDMACKVRLKDAWIDLRTTYISPLKDKLLGGLRYAKTEIEFRLKKCRSKPTIKARSIEKNDLEVPTGLGIDKEFDENEDLRRLFMLQPGVKPHVDCPTRVDAYLGFLVEDDSLGNDPFLYEKSAELTGTYHEHLSEFEGKKYYQRVEEGDRPDMYIFWGPAWRTEGAWFLADFPGAKWVAYNESQSISVPCTGWKIRSKHNINVDAPLQFEFRPASAMERDKAEEIAKELHMESIYAEMACHEPFDVALSDLLENAGEICDASKNPVIHYPWIDDEAVKHYPPEDTREGGVLGEMAIGIPFSDALGYACERVLPSSEEQTAEALEKTVSGTGEIVRSISQHRHTATCLEQLLGGAHCLVDIFDYCLKDNEPEVKTRGIELPKTPENVLFVNGMMLQWSEDPSAWYCNSCYETYKNDHGVPHFRCAQNDYDICPQCLPKFLPEAKSPRDDLQVLETEIAKQAKRKADLDFELSRLKSLKRRSDDLQSQLTNRCKENTTLQKQIQFQSQILEQQANGKAMQELQEARTAELLAELEVLKAESNECELRMQELEALVAQRTDEHADVTEQHSKRVADLQGHLASRKEASIAYDVQAKEVEVLYGQKIRDMETNYQKKLMAIGDNATDVRAAAQQLHAAHASKQQQHAADTGAIVQQCQNDLQSIERKRALHEAELKALRARMGEVESQAQNQVVSAQERFASARQAAEEANALQLQQLQDAVGRNSQKNATLESKIKQLEAARANVKQVTLPDPAELAKVKSACSDMSSAYTAQEVSAKELAQAHEQELRELAEKIAVAKEQLAQASANTRAPAPPPVQSDTALVVERFVADSMDSSALSLEVGSTVEVLSKQGAWATVKTPAGQTGEVPMMCLNLEGGALSQPQDQFESEVSGDISEVNDEIRRLQAELNMMHIDHTSRVVELETDVKTAKVVFDSLKRQLEMKTELNQVAREGNSAKPTKVTRTVSGGQPSKIPRPQLASKLTGPLSPVHIDTLDGNLPMSAPNMMETVSPGVYPTIGAQTVELKVSAATELPMQAKTVPNLRSVGGSMTLPTPVAPKSATRMGPAPGGSMTLSPVGSQRVGSKVFTPNVNAMTSKRVTGPAMVPGKGIKPSQLVTPTYVSQK